jgi:PAS domain S-box-containing protein
MKRPTRTSAFIRALGAVNRLNLFARFVLVLLAGIGLLVAGLSYEFGRVVRREMMELEGRVTAEQVGIIAGRELPSEAAFSAALRDANMVVFRKLEREILRIPEVIRIKAWDTQMRVVYSDEPKLIGQAFPLNGELRRALQGEVEVKMGLLKAEHVYEAQRVPERRLLEVYVPLRSSAGRPPYGVVEVYIYSPSFFAHLDQARRNLWLLSAAGGTGVFLSLGGMFWRAWRKERDLTAQLENARRFNEDIIEHVDVGIMVLDRDFVILSWNKGMERFCGAELKRERVLGRRFFDLFARLSTDPLHARLAEILRTGAAYFLYARPCPICENGQERIVNIKLVPINDETGRPSKVLMTVEDITEVRKLEAQLIHSEKLATIGEMYASLTHEINNPLGVIVSKAKMLLAEGQQTGYPPDLMKDLEQIDRHSSRIAEIVRNLLTFARKATFEKKPVDMNRLIIETAALVQKPFAKSDVRIDCALQPDLPMVQGDSNLLQQVLMNLLSNARDAMPHGGRIWIRTRRAPEYDGVVTVEVEDEGIGIGPEIIDKIFHPFFTTKEVGKGTGLGLSVSYGIVQSHGGDLRVKNREGAGAIFSIVLPIEDQEG